MPIRITFLKKFEKYNDYYRLYDFHETKINPIPIQNNKYGLSLLFDEEGKKYIIINPKTDDIVFYRDIKDLESEFFIQSYKDYRMVETFMKEKLDNYEFLEVKIERIIKSLFKITYNSMDFDQKLEYMRSSPNRNIEGLKGIDKFDNIKIKLTSKNDETDEILNCDCIAITSDGGSLKFDHIDEDRYIWFLFIFDAGYIEVIYENYYQSLDLGSLFRPLSSKIVIDNESFDGFFRDISHKWYKDNFYYYRNLYPKINNNINLDFYTGLEKPEPDKILY